MRYLSIALAVAGLGTASWAAYRWFKASVVKFPDNLTVEVPEYTGPHVTVNALVDTHAALVIASKLNKSAAFWTGVSALLNALGPVSNGDAGPPDFLM